MPAILAHWAVADKLANFVESYMTHHISFFKGNEDEQHRGFSKYLFLGANGPDLPYFHHVDIKGALKGIAGKSKHADLFHYNKQSEFILNLVRFAREITDNSIKNRILPYTMGHTTHLIADSMVHPYVNRFAGAYHSQQVKDLHKTCEVHQDSYLAQKYFDRSHIDRGQSWTHFLPKESSELNNVFNFIDQAFTTTYGEQLPVSVLKDSYDNYYNTAIDLAYDRAIGGVPRNPDSKLVNHEKVIDPKYETLLLDTTISKCLAAYQAVVCLYESDFSEDAQNLFRSQIKNWNMDTGYWIDVDMKDGELNITWKHTWCQ